VLKRSLALSLDARVQLDLLAHNLVDPVKLRAHARAARVSASWNLLRPRSGAVRERRALAPGERNGRFAAQRTPLPPRDGAGAQAERRGARAP
jgi:hypothetical protein